MEVDSGSDRDLRLERHHRRPRAIDSAELVTGRNVAVLLLFDASNPNDAVRLRRLDLTAVPARDGPIIAETP